MIHVEKLTKYYGDFCAVKGIDLDIKKGEIMGLLGPNGAGKTTTLRMLTGYLPPSSGTIRVKDHLTTDDMLPIKRLMGYLPESAPLYHNMLVFDYLNYVARIRGLTKDVAISRIKELATECGLNGIMHKGIGELSKGLKQRVGLAHALMDDPEILILDEPTSGLDPNQIVEIRDIIRSIGKEKTIILSTHILSEAEATCDRIIIIDKGTIVADGSTENLKKRSHEDNIINLSLKKALFEEVREALGNIEGVLRIEQTAQNNPDETGIRLTINGTTDLRETLYTQIKQTDWILLDMHQEAQSLENIFRELTRED